VDRNNGAQLALLFYERHLWAGLLGWPDWGLAPIRSTI
jgi:hypothetical protein